ncbi:hypothetical protein K474DRAFT_1580022, partial [Panus rudis PR-1116 ss-1]
RNLWEEAASGKYQVILFSPETLSHATTSSEFHKFITNEDVLKMLGIFAVDEMHLVNQWGKDFRKAYGQIKTVRAYLPEWTSFLALTATLEPGAETKDVLDSLGFEVGRFHFERRDCERYNISIITREIKYTISGAEFRDLDWLIPADIETPSDVPKTLLYCESIEFGHRVVRYL